MTIQNAYAERNKVVAALAQLLNSFSMFSTIKVGIAKHQGTEPWEDDWRNVLVIDTPNGQITWHFHDSEMYLLAGLPIIENYQYDGHSTEEKYNRLFKLLGMEIKQ